MKALKSKTTAIFILFITLFSFTSTIFAQNLAIWDFESATPAASFTETNMTADPAAFGPNQTGITYYSGNGSLWAYAATTWPTTPALNPDSYLEFTISPDVDYMIDITNFSFDHRRSSTGIRAWDLRSSLDGFSATLASNIVPDISNFISESIPLPPEFQDITTSISFRIYGFNAEATTGTWRFDNVIFSGIVEEIPVVPLTNAAILIGALLMVTFVVIRFRRG